MSENEQERLLCGHLITHIDPEINQLCIEKLGVDFTELQRMTLSGWAQFGQLGIDAKWLLDNLEKIEEIYGNQIKSIKDWNAAVARLAKKGIGAIESFDSNAVELAIALSGRNSKILEGEDRKANALALQQQMRSVNNQKDQVASGIVLARANAELAAARQNAANDAEVRAGVQAWRERAKNYALAAKMALNQGLAAFDHPEFPEQFKPENAGWNDADCSWAVPVSARSAPEPKTLGSGRHPDSISFNWSGNIAGRAKQFGSNVVRGAKTAGKWFGIGR